MRFASPILCLRIVAVALLVASAFSAGLRHAHPGGNVAHAHHPGHSTPADHAEHAPNGLQLLAAESHTHVYLFGFEFTVPAKDDGDEDSSRGVDLLLARLLGDDVNMTLSATATAGQDIPEAAPILTVLSVASSDLAMTAMAVAHLPLCDSARHERTGVLRI